MPTAKLSPLAWAYRCSLAWLSDSIKAKLAHWGKDAIHPGDILLTNDPEVMGSHLNHMIFSLPIFNDGELMAFASSMAHWPDVGGVLGGVTRDIYSEGIQLPFVKIFKAGVQDPELTSILRANCRNPNRAMGDFRAQVASIHALASGACLSCSAATATTLFGRACSSSPNRASASHARQSARFQTASTKPSRSWTTTR